MEWKTVEKSSGKKIKPYRQRGRIHLNIVRKVLKKESRMHKITVPKAPEQNVVAERMNQRLIESVRSILADAKLSHSFFTETRSTAVYLRNRSTSAAVKRKNSF